MIHKEETKEINQKPHTKLDVWKKSINFTIDIYNLCKKFPKEELFGISSQLKRAACSIPTNIAEGAARQTKKEFIQFLYIAQGSSSEVATFLEICKKLEWISNKEKTALDIKLSDISKMLTGLIKSLKR